MNIAALVDYDNLSEIQKSSGLLNLINKIIFRLDPFEANKAKCEVRIYGGWYDESQSMTSLAQDVSIETQRDFPALVRVATIANDICTVDVTAELAFALLEEPRNHLFGTYRKKSLPRNIKIESPHNVGCSHGSCPLTVARSLLRKGKCEEIGCTSSSKSLVYRSEQKLVDTMLTCDLLYLVRRGYDKLLVISDDDDFMPPIRSAILQGASVIKINPKGSQVRNSMKVGNSILTEVGI